MKKDPNYIKEALIYYPETGRFCWRADRPSSHYQRDWYYKKYLEEKAGKEVDFTINPSGYLQVRVGKYNYYAHQLAYSLVTGFFPEESLEIDHLDRNRANNRWSNLRCVTRTQNRRNLSKSPRNTSGYTGVVLDKRRNLFLAKVGFNNASKHLGYFETAEEAHACRVTYLEENPQLGFTETHGE